MMMVAPDVLSPETQRTHTPSRGGSLATRPTFFFTLDEFATSFMSVQFKFYAFYVSEFRLKSVLAKKIKFLSWAEIKDGNYACSLLQQTHLC